MNILFLLPLAFLVICAEESQIQTPLNFLKIFTITDENKAMFLLKWKAAGSSDATDPILGYKVKIWKVKKVKHTRHVFTDGKLEEIEVEELPELKLSEDPLGELTVLDVPANKTDALFQGVEIGVTYEMIVLAYTAKEEKVVTNKMRTTLTSITTS